MGQSSIDIIFAINPAKNSEKVMEKQSTNSEKKARPLDSALVKRGRYEPKNSHPIFQLHSLVGNRACRGSGRNFDFCYGKMKANFLQWFARV